MKSFPLVAIAWGMPNCSRISDLCVLPGSMVFMSLIFNLLPLSGLPAGSTHEVVMKIDAKSMRVRRILPQFSESGRRMVSAGWLSVLPVRIIDHNAFFIVN